MATLFNDPSIHYVKFLRGSVQAWEALQQTPNKISDDTLYFIYETAENTREGKLYLGQKLISGVGSGGGSNVFNINDLRDVVIDGEGLSDKQILVYNDHTQKWQNSDLSEIINTAVSVMQGATTLSDGVSGLVPLPTAGTRDRFLRVDGTWSPINIPTFDTDVFSLDANSQVSLQGYNLAPVGSVPIKTDAGIQWSTAVGKLTRLIVTEAELHELEDNSELDPDCIYMVARGDQNSSNKYDEYMVINGKLELLGVFGTVDLRDYVPYSVYAPTVQNINNILNDRVDPDTSQTIPGLVSRVSNLEQSFVSKAEIGDLNTLLLSPGNTTLVEEVNTITGNVTELAERLKWQELREET